MLIKTLPGFSYANGKRQTLIVRKFSDDPWTTADQFELEKWSRWTNRLMWPLRFQMYTMGIWRMRWMMWRMNRRRG